MGAQMSGYCSLPLNQLRALDVKLPWMSGQAAHFSRVRKTDCLMALLCTDAQICLRRHGLEIVLEPGQFAIVSEDAGVEIEGFGRAHLLAVPLPVSAIRARGGKVRETLVGPMPGDAGPGALVRHLVLGLYAQEQVNDEDALMMQDTLFNLIAYLLTRRVVAAPHARTVPARIRALIESRLADPGLSAAAIADALGMSVRSLQRRFDGTGQSFAQWVRQRRLQRCHDDLCNPRWCDVSIASIAWRWGFVDPAHFSRCFRERYGCSARALRKKARSEHGAL